MRSSGHPGRCSHSCARMPRVTEIAVQVHLVDPPHEDTLRSVELFREDVAPWL